MRYRTLGNTDLSVSELGFGCGSIGGLLVRGDYPDMRTVVARAIERGVTYFDTASSYGNGQSEANLGAVLRELRADVVVGTKVRFADDDLQDIPAAVTASVEASLRRLGRDSVDLIQFHNRLGAARNAQGVQVTLDDLQAVIDQFRRLQQQGKVRYFGITALGETPTLQAAIDDLDFHSIQSCYNLLNPTAGAPAPTGFPHQDFGQIIDRAGARQKGVIAIRVLAGGALSGRTDRHPVASASVNPIASAAEYGDDVVGAQSYSWLVEEGVVSSLVEAAVRFVLSKPQLSTALVGVSNLQQLDQAIDFAEKGPLPAEILTRIGIVRNRTYAP